MIQTIHTPIHVNKVNMKGWLWRPNDIQGPCRPKASWHLSYRWGKSSKKPHPGNLSRPGIEPGPAAWQERRLPPTPQRCAISFSTAVNVKSLRNDSSGISVCWFCYNSLLELEAYNLAATQKSIIVQTHLLLITCPPDLESNQRRRVTVFCVTLSFPSSPDSVLLLKGIHHPYRLSHLSADLKRH